MRLLFDENLPFALAALLPEHHCATVKYMGWRGVKNGELLKRAETEGFNAVLTLDSNIQTQQNLAARKISLVVLRPRSQGKSAILELADEIGTILSNLGEGSLVEVSATS